MNSGATWSRAALVLLQISACRTDPSQIETIVRDSAGVVVVEHGPELPGDVEHWSLEPTPMSNIGNVEGGEEYHFTRIVQASALSRNHVLVADRATSDLRVFDSTGRFLHRFGRNGSGPGEFRELTWVGVDRSGSIATFDRSLRRISWFAGTGELEQVITLPSSAGTTSAGTTSGYVVGLFGDRSILMRHVVGPSEKDPAKLSTGLVRDSIGVFLLAADGSRSTPIGRLPGHQSIRAVGPGIIAMDPAPFGLRTVIVVADTVFYVSTQEAYEVRTYRKDGVLQRILRRRVTPQPVSASAKAEWQRQWARRMAGFKGSVPPPVAEIAKYNKLPDVFPAHNELLVDRAGNLWVEDYRPFASKDARTTWTVFGQDGSILATAELPNAQITEIGADRVVSVWRGENDVPYVRVYRLAR